MPMQIPPDLFVETEKLIIKFIWNCTRFRINKQLFKKNKVGFTFLNFTS